MIPTPAPSQLLAAMAALVVLAAGARSSLAQRAGESGLLDPKSGRFANLFTNEPARDPDTVAAPAAKVFAALPAVYEALPLPLSLVDTSSSARMLGGVRITVRRPLGGNRLSMLLECGTGIHGPNAERYTLQVTAMSVVQPLDATRSLVQTRVEGSATPNGLSTSVRCTSTGRLEELILGQLRKELGL
jgi:hypothetical protein